MKIRLASRSGAAKAPPQDSEVQMHPQSRVIQVCIVLFVTLGMTGVSVATHTNLGRVGFMLGFGCGAAFAVAVMLMLHPIRSNQSGGG